jgi:hypothetical protein
VIQSVVIRAFAPINVCSALNGSASAKDFSKSFQKKATLHHITVFVVSAWLRNENLPAFPIMETAC